MTKFIEVNDGTFDHIKMFIKHNHLDENNFDFAIVSVGNEQKILVNRNA